MIYTRRKANSKYSLYRLRMALAIFALVEAGFARVKNTANIQMKNFVDFMFGCLLHWFISFGLMFGAGGFIGMPHFFDLSFYDGGGLPTEGFLVFQTVFYANDFMFY